jgi:hypothetical protein
VTAWWLIAGLIVVFSVGTLWFALATAPRNKDTDR